jgi:hypothetical protein
MSYPLPLWGALLLALGATLSCCDGAKGKDDGVNVHNPLDNPAGRLLVRYQRFSAQIVHKIDDRCNVR